MRKFFRNLDMNDVSIEIYKDEHDDVGPIIRGKELEDIVIMVPYDIDISEFLYMNKVKGIFNHHFDNDPMSDTNKEDEVEVYSPFLQGITHNDRSSHIMEVEDHYFPMHEDYWKQ